jgi:L-threonylcarbamoyladenylate synthase
MLRALDRPEHSAIAVMSIPEQGLGVAINDRLRRAAAPRGPVTLPEQPLTP